MRGGEYEYLAVVVNLGTFHPSPDDEPGLPKKRVRLNNDSNEKQDNGSGDKSDQPMDEACFQDDSD
jgi:hypothetical protein